LASEEPRKRRPNRVSGRWLLLGLTASQDEVFLQSLTNPLIQRGFGGIVQEYGLAANRK
jgi:hypothetical protein